MKRKNELRNEIRSFILSQTNLHDFKSGPAFFWRNEYLTEEDLEFFTDSLEELMMRYYKLEQLDAANKEADKFHTNYLSDYTI